MNNKLLTQLKIFKLMDTKPNFSELARIYSIDRRTIKKYYDGYEGKPKHHKKFCRLDLYQDLIIQKLQIRGITLKAVYEFLVSEVDSEIGGYSNFLKYAKSRKLAPTQSCSGHPRFETPPGYQAQVDWKEDLKLHNRNGIVYTLQVFDYKLGHSRYCHFTYKTTRTRQDVFDCLIASFQATGGVPTEILFDNMASVVDLSNGQRRVNPQMRHFADDFRFKIRLAKPRHPFTKGKVEAANKFLTWLLPYDREFDTEEDLIRILEKINQKVNQQICQETSVPPILLLQKEKEHLQSLPNQRIIESYLSHDRQIKVQKDSMITYKNHKYSVPPTYIGKNVWIRPTEERLYIYYNTEMIAVHNHSEKRLNYHKDHYTELLGRLFGPEDSVARIAEANLRQMDDFL